MGNVGPENSLATPESSSFSDELTAIRPTEKSRKRKVPDDEAETRARPATPEVVKNVQAESTVFRKKAKLENNDTDRTGHENVGAMNFGDEMGARNGRYRSNDL